MPGPAIRTGERHNGIDGGGVLLVDRSVLLVVVLSLSIIECLMLGHAEVVVAGPPLVPGLGAVVGFEVETKSWSIIHDGVARRSRQLRRTRRSTRPSGAVILSSCATRSRRHLMEIRGDQRRQRPGAGSASTLAGTTGRILG